MAFKIFFTEVASPFSQALVRELERHTFAVVMPTGATEIIYTQSYDDPGVVIDTRAYAGLTVPNECGGMIHNLPVIHLSSGEVFAETENGSGFFELDPPNGASSRAVKLIEAEVRALAQVKSLVLRLPLLVDVQPGGWFETLLSRLSTESWLSVSETTRLDPVCMKEACRVVIALVQQIACGAENWGVMHLRSAEPCLEAEFADHLVRQLKKEQWSAARLDVIKGSSIWTGAASVLAGRRLTDTFGVQMRSWRLGVKPLMQQWIEQRRQMEAAMVDS